MNRTRILIALFALFTAVGAAADVSFGPSATTSSWSESASYTTSIDAVTNTGRQTETRTISRTVSRSKSCSAGSMDASGRIDSLQVRYASGNHPASGKAYVVTPHDVTYTNGAAPPESEAAFVRADNSAFGQFRALSRIFGGKTFHTGERTSVNANDAEELFNIADGNQLQGVSVTLQSADNGVATFAVDMTLRSNPKKKDGAAAGGSMTMSLSGTLKMTVSTVRPAQLDVHGTIDAKTKKPDNSNAPASASGSTSIRIDYSF